MNTSAHDTGSSPLGQNERVQIACDLAGEIRRRRVVAKDGSITWLGPWNPPLDQPVRIRPVGPHLYSGTAGIALFFAALYHVEGDIEHRQFCLETLDALRRQLAGITSDPARTHTVRMGIGGCVGLGGFAYALWKIGGWLGEPDLRAEARALLPLFSRERIAADTYFDLIFGSAGAIASVLAFGEKNGENEESDMIASIADSCARHLASGLLEQGGQPAGWPTLPGFPPLSGLGHGAAGIAYSLLRLYEGTGQSDHLHLAAQALAFERTLFSSAHRNWRDARSPIEQFMTSWCHGAPGIALARLGALDTLDTPWIREDVGNALATTRAYGLAPLDHVCCGNLGRVEVLLYAFQKLGDEALLDEAVRLATTVVRRSQYTGSYRWVLPDSDAFDPSFFTGAAGVGYTLLRLALPDRLPCVLLLE
jgi:type 2 lantibiotic biosynthesis protein LanM